MKMTVSMLGGAPRATRSLGGILIDSGQLTPEDAERVLQLQKEQNLRFGEAAVQLGLLTEADIQYALSRQFAYAYLRKTPGEKKPVSDELVAAYQPFSPRVEQLRAIRSQLMLRWFDKAELRQVLTIVGAEPRRGPQLPRGQPGGRLLAARRAHAAGRCRPARRRASTNSSTSRTRSASRRVLSGRSREEAIVRIPDLAGLCVLPAGPMPPNPLELLNRLNFDEFMIQVKASFDVVIIDTPALAAGEDGAMMAVRTGAALADRAQRHDPDGRLQRHGAGPHERRRGRRRLGAERSAAEEAQRR